MDPQNLWIFAAAESLYNFVRRHEHHRGDTFRSRRSRALPRCGVRTGSDHRIPAAHRSGLPRPRCAILLATDASTHRSEDAFWLEAPMVFKEQ
jgi:hypothetical protein